MTQDWRAAADRIVRLHNPVATGEHPALSEADLRARPPVVVGMGRLSPEKGFDVLIAAMSLVPEPARLVIYGEGPERQRLQALIGRLGLAGRVSLPGYIADPWKAYAAGRCFASASYQEAFGLAVVEALASGLPVVATTSGGPEEILDHGRYGALVPPGDPGALASAIVEALDQPGDPALRVARAQEFDVRAVAARYMALFEEVLADV